MPAERFKSVWVPGAVVPVVGAVVGGGAYAMMAMNCVDNGGCLKVSQGSMLVISSV